MLNRYVQKFFVPYRANKKLQQTILSIAEQIISRISSYFILIHVQLFSDFHMRNDTTIRKQIGLVVHFRYLCFVFVMLTCLVIAALLSPAGKGLTCVMFYCVFVTFPCGFLGQVWYLIVSIPDPCLLTYFEMSKLYFHEK